MSHQSIATETGSQVRLRLIGNWKLALGSWVRKKCKRMPQRSRLLKSQSPPPDAVSCSRYLNVLHVIANFPGFEYKGISSAMAYLTPARESDGRKPNLPKSVAGLARLARDWPAGSSNNAKTKATWASFPRKRAPFGLDRGAR